MRSEWQRRLVGWWAIGHYGRIWLVILTLSAVENPVDANERLKEKINGEALLRAFRAGLSQNENGRIKVNLKLDYFGNSIKLSGFLKDSRFSEKITCLICLSEEILTRARALGAIVAAKEIAEEPARLSVPDLAFGSRVFVDGIPFAPAQQDHPIESGQHQIVILQNEKVFNVDVNIEKAEVFELDVSEALATRNSNARPQVILGGLGLTAAALGGLFLWLDGKCATNVIDGDDDCREQHDLKGAGWGLVAGGILVEAAILVWLLWPGERVAVEKEKGK